MNTVIVGGPKTGKTTLADSLGKRARHTDELIGDLGWSAASERVSHWFDEPGEWVIEGVATVRAIRKWLARESGLFPAEILFLTQAKILLSPGQVSMTKGICTVWEEILPELKQRNTVIHYK